MNEDLQNEVEAINSIYGDGSLVPTDEGDVLILHLPGQGASLRLQFPSDYPTSPPVILGTHSSGDHTRKGEAARIVALFRDTLGVAFHPGEVCLFDTIEAVTNTFSTAHEGGDYGHEGSSPLPQDLEVSGARPILAEVSSSSEDLPQWILSDVVVELKSVFVARCAQVSSTDQAKHYLQHLLDSDRKVRSATHNITSWRIRGDNGVTFQDCDDDGETAAGGRLLHLMQLMNLWNVMVVVTRWYGGHQLGPKRFSIINAVARDAFVKGGFVQEDSSSKKKGKR